MKKVIAAFFSFSRMERLGIAVLTCCILLLLVLRATMALWVVPKKPDSGQEFRMARAYKEWKEREMGHKPGPGGGIPEVYTAAALFPFDPNTLDSIGFIRLGMPQKAVQGLLNWRKKGKHFYKAEDLKPLYNLPEENYLRLAPYVSISADKKAAPFEKGFSNAYADIPAVIELNAADSALLDRGVNGIGATLAHKIVARRLALGGFVRHEQLLEVYRFPDTTFQKMKSKLHIDLKAVRRMNLNTSSLEQLSAHPYIGEKMAKNILLYRQGIKSYNSIEQLREVPLMNEENYRKIAPYFVVE